MNRRELAKLKEVRDLLTLERFGGTSRANTDLVRKELAIFLESWIYPDLDEIIQKAEERFRLEDEKKAEERAKRRRARWRRSAIGIAEGRTND